MRRAILVGMLLSSVFVSCAITDTNREIPAPYLSQLMVLRTKNIAMERQCAELSKQIENLRAEQHYNINQMNIVGSEALNSLNLSADEWSVNVDEMKIISKKAK